MKSLYLSLICFLTLSACKPEKKEIPMVEEPKQLSIAEKIANAHGYNNWDNVEKIAFTFQVDRDTLKGKGRSWVWHPKEDKVTLSAEFGSVEYYRSQMDSTHVKADQGFINDKFWLLVPFQLVWDTTANISEPVKSTSPIAKKQLNKITITYPNEGGYTPGDAYDIYYDNSYLIREWVFRQGNSKEPSLTNTFEDYKDFNGIKIAISHKKEGSNWNLNFSDVSITLK